MSFFKINHQSSKSKARLGTIATDHGVIQTPAFVPVGTKGTIKGLTQEQIKDLKIQLSFVNTYHLVIHPGVEVLQTAGGIHAFAHYSIPLMSDSGGFQVFSLAQKERINDKLQIINNKSNSNVKLQNKRVAGVRGDEKPLVEKISNDGVMFRSLYDGQLVNFTPETSMDFQRVIGADINMAFDECTYHPATHEYAERAMERTHRWLKRCIQHRSVIPVKTGIQEKNKEIIDWIPASAEMTQNTTNHYPPFDFAQGKPTTSHQYLYGIIQGGIYEDLRKKSAEFVVGKNTPGVAIGGVSVGETKEEMRKQVEWVAPYLPKDRPVHLLGVGQVDDIVDLVEFGIDTFDCVEPTRLARVGRVYETKKILEYVETRHGTSLQAHTFDFDINKLSNKSDLTPLDENCHCSTCMNYSKAYLYHLFKQRELLGYTLLSYHNLFVMECLMEQVRIMIEANKL